MDSSTKYPRCDALWKIGQHLPADFDGTCSTATTTENDGGYECADGSHVWLYQDGSRDLYALPGEPIKTMSKDEWLRYLIGTCKPN